MKSVGEAREIILQSVPAALEEKLPLLQAHRRVLAETVIAEADIPAFDNSSMDGFALSSEDTQRANQSIPVTLQLAGEVAAGSVLSQAIPAGSAVRIMTGAPIPRGANAVIEQEAVVARNGIVQVGIPVAEGRNIRKKGEDIRSGATILELGTLMKAAHLGVLASLGVSHVSVYRKPTVAFLATGNELVDLSQEPEEGQIRNSNAYTLWGLVEESGGVPVNLGTAKDDEHELMEKLRRGLSYDMLMTSGGVSVGAYDYVLKALEDLGVQRKFWKVNIKPGMPLVFGVYHDENRQRDVPVFGLPGNPVSTMVTFLQFVRPALYRMTGREGSAPFSLKAVLEHDLPKKDGKRHFVRGIVRNENHRLLVQSTGTQSSGVLTSMTKANCFIVMPEDSAGMKAGEDVEIELL